MAVTDHDPESGSLDPASGMNTENPSREAASVPLSGDPISDVLETVRLQGAVFFLWEPVWPYGMSVADGRDLSPYLVPGTDCIVSYHVVTRGPCWAAVRDEPPIRLETGDTIVLPRGDPYRISSAPGNRRSDDSDASIEFFRSMSAGRIPPVVRAGGRGPEKNELICGFLGCSMGPWNPLLSSLPRLLRIPSPPGGNDPLSPLIAFALSESRQNRGGERCLLMRLSEVMFIEVLRRYLRSGQDPLCGWLGALRDPLAGRALSLLHRNVASAWTLRELARNVGASRSTLAERFTRVVGIPPMQYLTRWRMQVAANRLRDTTSKIHAIASDVGYESEEAFSRAFKRVVGTAPGEWRKRA